MDRGFFLQTKSRLHRTMKQTLGSRDSGAYLVVRRTEKRRKVFGIDIDPNAIRFDALTP